MSRSFKHTPGYTDQQGSRSGTRFFKRLANRKIRHYEDLVNGGMYKKCYQSYNIRDYEHLCFTKNDWAYIYINSIYPTLRERIYKPDPPLPCLKDLKTYGKSNYKEWRK